MFTSLLSKAQQGGKQKERTFHPDSSSIQFGIKIDNLAPGDTLELYVQKYYLDELMSYQYPGKVYSGIVGNDGICRFKVTNITQPVYISFTKGHLANNPIPRKILSDYLASPGDDIKIKIDSIVNIGPEWYAKAVHFHGIGAKKYIYRYTINRDSPLWPLNPDSIKARKSLSIPKASVKGLIEQADTIKAKSILLLQSIKSSITPLEYSILRADIIGDYFLSKNNALFRFIAYDDADKRDFCLPYRKQYFKEIEDSRPFDTISLSRSYAASLVLYYKAKHDILNNGEPDNIYPELEGYFKGALREKLITDYLLRKKDRLNSDMLNNYNAALSLVKNPYYRELLKDILDQLGPGTKVKNFSLPDKNGNLIGINEFKGKVILLDFWYTGCGPCVNFYLNTLKHIEEEFKGKGIVFITISIDPKEKWVKSLESGVYTSNSAINLYTNGQGKNHQVLKEYKVSGYPRPLLIDGAGQIITSDRRQLIEIESLRKLIQKAIINP